VKLLREARLDWGEVSGSLGDLGTFLPLLVGMAAQNGLDFGASLFFAGAFNVVTGLVFSIPMAVQPMKAIAVVALTQGLSAGQIVAAGACVSLVVLVLGVTGLVQTVADRIPASVVRGLQLALGLTLVAKGAGMAGASGPWLSWEGKGVALAAAAVVLAGLRARRLPSALLLFLAGVVVACASHPDVAQAVSLSPYLPRWSPPAWADFQSAFGAAAVPQIPLTLLNSVVAVCALSVDLFPSRPAQPRPVAVSVGLMNLVGCGFGAMPMCHGAGGLAGQYAFGARTNGAILFLGTAKLAVVMLFGATLMPLCRAFPGGILGVMLAASGLELALVCRNETERSGALSMLATAGACMAGNSPALGLAAGLVVWAALPAGPARRELGAAARSSLPR
jgi:hypothetical protein